MSAIKRLWLLLELKYLQSRTAALRTELEDCYTAAFRFTALSEVVKKSLREVRKREQALTKQLNEGTPNHITGAQT
jgi:hypothetical protein